MAPEPVKTDITEARLIGAMKSIQPGQKFWVAVHLKIKDGWHTYWQNPGDSGVPPQLKWTLPNGFTASELHLLAPSRYNYIGEINYGYHGDAYFLTSITAPDALRPNANYIISLKASWLVCEEQCIPESADLSLVLRTNDKNKSETGEYFDLLAKLVSKLPKPISDPVSFTVKEGQVMLELPTSLLKENATRAEFYPVQMGVIVNKSEQVLAENFLTMQRGDDKLPPKFEGVVSVYDEASSRRDYKVELAYTETLASLKPSAAVAAPINSEISGLWQAILFALLGGLILNAMPCVFPVLSLKALDIVRQSHGHAKIVKQRGLAYTAGVIISFMVMAVVLILIQHASGVVEWGAQFQSPLVIGLFAYLLFLIGLNLSGAFEVPMLFGGMGDTLTRAHDWKGSFFTGVLAVLVATPCTAPFMGGAIGYAFTQSSLVILVIFTAMGLGMALPFLCLSFYPKLASKLPKPGEWMETFKNALAFPMYLSVLWLLWVLGRQTDTDTLSLMILGLIILVFTIWLWQLLSAKDVLIRIGIAIPLIILSFAPLWFLPAESVNRNADSCAAPATLEHGEPFTKARLDQLRGQGRAVFVNATAAWCITCQINERTTLSRDVIKKAFDEKNVAYLVADWTNRNDEITSYLDSFGRRGVPLYVYYPAKGDAVVLPQLLTESIVTEAISK